MGIFRFKLPFVRTETKRVKDGDKGQDLDCSVEVGIDGATIEIDGYGTFCDKKPILLTLIDGRLNLVVWADINDDSPTHEIDLESARIGMRSERCDPS